MQLKYLKNTDITNKTILYRAPYDIGVEEINGKLSIKDDSRIKATLPTLEYLLQNNCKIVILTWVKRPEGFDPKLTTAPHAKKLAQLLNHPVEYVNKCIGREVQDKIAKLQTKQILMLENVRFYKEEYDDVDEFAKQLTLGSELIVFDAFPQAHRKHASTTGILRHLPAVSGFYFEQEYNSLSGILESPAHPFTLVIGGAKLSEKFDAVKNLMNKADVVLIGGGIANIFLKAEGRDIANSYIEDTVLNEKTGQKTDQIEEARKLLTNNPQVTQFATRTDLGVRKLFIPHDGVIGKSIDNDSDAKFQLFANNFESVEHGYGIYDIGKVTTAIYYDIIMQSKTVFWACPMGVYEKPNYSQGTLAVAKAISETSAKTIVAGGDTIDALNRLGDPSKVDHISLAGGATLDYLGGKELVVLDKLLSPN